MDRRRCKQVPEGKQHKLADGEWDNDIHRPITCVAVQAENEDLRAKASQVRDVKEVGEERIGEEG